MAISSHTIHHTDGETRFTNGETQPFTIHIDFYAAACKAAGAGLVDRSIL